MDINRGGFFSACLVLAGLLLASGYLMAGLWWMAVSAVIVILLGWLGARSGWRWMPAFLLVSLLALAAGGVFAGASPVVMIAGSVLALVCWDTVTGIEADGTGKALEGKLDRRYFTVLTGSALVGLMISAAGSLSRLVLPYGLVILAGLLVLFGLYRYYQSTRL